MNPPPVLSPETQGSGVEQASGSGTHPVRRGLLLAGLSLLLFLCAFGVRLAYLTRVESTPFRDERRMITDARYYDMRAREIAGGDLLGDAPGFLSPVYCYALGGAYALAGESMHVGKMLQVLLGAFSCVLLYWIGLKAFSGGIGLLAGFILAFYGLHIYYTGLLLPTVLVVFLNLLALFFLLPSRRPAAWRFLLGGLVLGLAIGAKPNALLFLPFLGLWILLAFRDASLRRRFLWGLLLLAGTAASIAPVTLRNYLVSGEFVLVTTTGGRNLLKGNGEGADGSHVFLPGEDQGTKLGLYIKHKVDNLEAVREGREMTAQALSVMLGDPLQTLGLFARKFFLFFNSIELGIRDQYYFTKTRFSFLRLPWVGFGLLAPFGIAGLILSWRRRNRAGLIRGLLGVQAASFVLVFVLARYRLVAVACLALFASWTLFEVAALIRRRRWGRSGGTLLLVAGAAVFVNWPAPGFTTTRGWGDQYEFLASIAFDADNLSKAEELYSKALEYEFINPVYRQKPWFAEGRLAVCQLQQGKKDAARETTKGLIRKIDAYLEGVEADIAKGISPGLETPVIMAREARKEMKHLLARINAYSPPEPKKQ
ncbi:MAG: glycosyltransferase family 39 protein [Planctomycetota bacterium]